MLLLLLLQNKGSQSCIHWYQRMTSTDAIELTSCLLQVLALRGGQ